VTEKKTAYCTRLLNALQNNSNFLLVSADNVGSRHMQSIRSDLTNKGHMLMGKNTLIRRALRDPTTIGAGFKVNPHYANIIPYIKGNVGFVFTNGDLIDLKKTLLANQVGAAAKPGMISPCDVFVPKGPTGMDPTQTSFFQALNIATMISRGQIEIKADVHLIKEGDKVGASESTLLQKLAIRPFFYGLKVVTVCDNGACYDAKVLDITPESLINAFTAGLRNIAAIGFATGQPNAASVPHSLINALNAVVSVSIQTNYNIPASAAIKAYLADPSAFVVAAPAASSGAAAPVEEEKKKSESEADVGAGGLFGDDEAGGADY
jgi:large subunit ribosomal protein LP0